MLNKFSNIYYITYEYIFYLYIFLLPWQTRYIIKQGLLNGFWEYGTFSLYAVDIILILLVLLAICYKKNNQQKFFNSYNILFIIFWVTTFIACYFALNKEVALYFFLRITSLLILSCIILKINFNLIKISWSFVSAGFLQSSIAICQFSNQNIVANKWLGIAAHNPNILGEQVIETATGRFLRAYGSLPHPNILAGFLVVCLLFNIYLLFIVNQEQKINYFKRVLLLICLLIISSGLFFTFSRNAFISLFMALLFLLYFVITHLKLYRLVFSKIIICFVLVLTTLTLIYPDIVFSRFNYNLRLEKKSLSERSTLILDSLTVIKKNWVTGVGGGNFTQATHDIINKSKLSYEYQPVHNIYLLIIAEYGFLSFLILILLLINAFKKIKANNLEHLILVTIIISLLTLGLFDHFLFSFNFGLVLFFIPIFILNKSVDNLRKNIT